jgi:hypothetical protein
MKKKKFNSVKKIIPVFLFILISVLFQGCMFYYKVQTRENVNSIEMRRFDSLNKYFILHMNDTAWNLRSLKTSATAFSGLLDTLPKIHTKYKTTDPREGNRYKIRDDWDESCVLQEVHLYLQDSLYSAARDGDSLKITYGSIRKAEVYTKDKGKTTTSWLLPAILVPLVGVPVLIISIAGASGGGQVSMGL